MGRNGKEGSGGGKAGVFATETAIRFLDSVMTETLDNWDELLSPDERNEFCAELIYAARPDQRSDEMVDSIMNHWWRWAKIVKEKQ